MLVKSGLNIPKYQWVACYLY